MLLVCAVLLAVAPQALAYQEGPRPVDLGTTPYVLGPLGPHGALDALGRYIVVLKGQPLASYRGSIPGLEATNPAARDERKLDAGSEASQRYLAYLDGQLADALAEAEQVLGRPLDPAYEYVASLFGFAVDLTPEEVDKLERLERVRYVERERILYPNTDAGPEFMGAPGIWNGTQTGGLPGTYGEGIIVGVIDTGIDPWNPSFADVGGDGYDHTNPFGSGNYVGVCDPGNTGGGNVVPYDPTFPCNDKLIGVWGYTDSDPNPRDSDGHGSHTGSTTAGNFVYGAVIETATATFVADISGVAPHANIIAYDGCRDGGGCPGSSLQAARDQALLDGVDVINYSIGGGVTVDPWEPSSEAESWLNIRDAGVFVATSAGNSGPGLATLGAPGDLPWITSVGASTHDRTFLNAITLDDGVGPPLTISGESMTGPLADPAPVLLSKDQTFGGSVDPEDARLCGSVDGSGDEVNPWPPNAFNGEIVVCERGVYGRVQKGQWLAEAGAGGYVLAQPDAFGGGPGSLAPDPHALPGVHIDYYGYQALLAYLADAPGIAYGTIAGSVQAKGAQYGDIMASFSSRGPNSSWPLADVLVPKVTAPGRGIWAAYHQGAAGDGDYTFNVIQGTSMSSPHVAGAGALLVALQPAWTPAEIESAIMTTGVQEVLDDDGANPATPFAKGAGRVDLSAAGRAGMLLDVTTVEFQNADPDLGGDPKALNLASMSDSNCYQTCSWTRTVRNPTGQSLTWSGVFEGLDGLEGTLSPASLSFNAGQSKSFTLTIDDVTGLQPGSWYFGTVTWTELGGQAPAARFPVAIRVGTSTDDGVITKTADKAGTGVGGTITYDITLINGEDVQRTYALADDIPANASYVAGSATGGLTYDGGTDSLSWTGDLDAALFTIEERVLSGYQSMAALGVPPLDLGDLNRDTGCFLIGGMNYQWFGTMHEEAVISVNGVMRAGQAVLPLCPSNTNQDFPSPDAPFRANDNLIAPFWADLNMSEGNIYAVLTTYDGKSVSVFEWENARVVATGAYITFQLWIEDGTSNMWFAYPPDFDPGSASPSATVGGENDIGSIGETYYYNGAGTLPDGSTDVWIGLKPTTRSFSFQVTATGAEGSSILNEANVTVASSTASAWANAYICGPASAAPVIPSIVGYQGSYVGLNWADSASIHDTYQVWRSASPYFTPGNPGTEKVYEGSAFSYNDNSSGASIGDPDANYYYLVRTVNCAGTSSADSNQTAEFDYAMMPGQP